MPLLPHEEPAECGAQVPASVAVSLSAEDASRPPPSRPPLLVPARLPSFGPSWQTEVTVDFGEKRVSPVPSPDITKQPACGFLENQCEP